MARWRTPGSASRRVGIQRGETERAHDSADDDHRRVPGHRARRPRALLDRLRATIRSIVPRAEECISYGIPAFRLHGAVIAGFCARAQGCSYLPFSGTTLAALAGDLRPTSAPSPPALRPDAPLPARWCAS